MLRIFLVLMFAAMLMSITGCSKSVESKDTNLNLSGTVSLTTGSKFSINFTRETGYSYFVQFSKDSFQVKDVPLDADQSTYYFDVQLTRL